MPRDFVEFSSAVKGFAMPWKPTLTVVSQMTAASHMTVGLAQSILDFVYPPQCLFCERALPSTWRARDRSCQFCEMCRSQFVPPAGNTCHRCGTPLGLYTVSEQGCLACLRESFAFDEVIRLGLYRDELRRACLMAKNSEGALLGRALAGLLVEEHRSLFTSGRFDTIVPVPEHWLKRLGRPHYAAETIAREIAHQLNLRMVTGILAKHRWTPKQARSSKTERRHQQHDSFCTVSGLSLKGQTILLADDILTTGATASEAARVLKRAGASRVIVVVLAVSPPTA